MSNACTSTPLSYPRLSLLETHSPHAKAGMSSHKKKSTVSVVRTLRQRSTLSYPSFPPGHAVGPVLTNFMQDLQDSPPPLSVLPRSNNLLGLFWMKEKVKKKRRRRRGRAERDSSRRKEIFFSFSVHALSRSLLRCNVLRSVLTQAV